jgi:hypothetical protein
VEPLRRYLCAAPVSDKTLFIINSKNRAGHRHRAAALAKPLPLTISATKPPDAYSIPQNGISSKSASASAFFTGTLASMDSMNRIVLATMLNSNIASWSLRV